MNKMGENPVLNPDAYSQFVKMQGPAIQGLMSNYLEQSANAFLDMQQQMQKQARNMFGTFPFSGIPGTQETTDDSPQPATEKASNEEKSG